MVTSLKPNSSLRDYQNFVSQTYGPNNLRHFTVNEMLTNINRFSMRGLKGIRKKDDEKIKVNNVVALSWFLSLLNQLGIDLEDAVWERFPYVCSYCKECPCACRAKKIKKRIEVKVNSKLRPKTIREWQKMFEDIYPSSTRTIEEAGIHAAEETGELSEAVLQFRGHHTDHDFANVRLEAADLFTCFMATFNSLKFDYESELVKMFGHGCHSCKKSPCECEYNFIVNFKS